MSLLNSDKPEMFSIRYKFTYGAKGIRTQNVAPLPGLLWPQMPIHEPSSAFVWTVPDCDLWAEKNRSVCRTLIGADFVVAPETTEGPRAKKAQIALAIRAYRHIVARHPPCVRHAPFWHEPPRC